MILPKTIEILNRTYKVIEKDMLREGDAIGICFPFTGVINVEKCLNNQVKAGTFLHEILHAMLDSMGHQIDSGLHTEQNVTIITNGLATIMRDNPDTIKSIVDGLERDDLEEDED